MKSILPEQLRKGQFDATLLDREYLGRFTFWSIQEELKNEFPYRELLLSSGRTMLVFILPFRRLLVFLDHKYEFIIDADFHLVQMRPIMRVILDEEDRLDILKELKKFPSETRLRIPVRVRSKKFRI